MTTTPSPAASPDPPAQADVSPGAPPDAAHVTVLLATHNGAAWLPEQLQSLARQRAVKLRVVASDDASTDGTPSLLARPRSDLVLSLLPPCARMGSAQLNFLRLICEADIGDAAYVALCDQDDIWYDDKLERSIAAIRARGLDAYSSDVLAFWPDGRERRLKKAGKLRRHDHLFESAGPGCSFVLTRAAFDTIRGYAQLGREVLGGLKHDWWIYARGRVEGWRWFIDPVPTLRYRQHGRNEIGANVGWAAARRRWQAVRSGAYRREALAVAKGVGDRSRVVDWLERYGWRERLALSLRARECRRRLPESALLALFHWAARRES